MLILKDARTAEGEWHTLTIRGEKVELKIRPLDAELMREIRSRHRQIKRERDPQTRQMVRVEVFDEEAISDELIDHVLEDFRGVGDDKGVSLPVNLTNKKRVLAIPPAGDEISVSEFVFQRASELAAEKVEEEEAEIKNLKRLPDGATQ